LRHGVAITKKEWVGREIESQARLAVHWRGSIASTDVGMYRMRAANGSNKPNHFHFTSKVVAGT